jgi:hypothetical protein
MGPGPFHKEDSMIPIVYKGLKKEQQERQIVAALKAAKPPEQRGERNQNLNISSKDRTRTVDSVLRAKQAAIKKWREDFEKELRKSVAESDASTRVMGIVFKKGEVVQIPDDHPILRHAPDPKTGEPTGKTKLDGLLRSGAFEIAKPEQKPEKKAG